MALEQEEDVLLVGLINIVNDLADKQILILTDG